MKIKQIETDILIIGGGTAGCYAALTIAENAHKQVVVLEKANIKRSGCLAAGVNALNAYIVKGQTPQDYVDYAKKDAHGIAREDLLLSMSQRLNKVTHKLEALGLVILKDETGDYVARGNRNIKINGENIKPILASSIANQKNIHIINRVYAIDYITHQGEIIGAYGLSVDEEILYVIGAKAVICTTGGAAGLYKPNNPGYSRHKMWYSPFNTGAGYAMGIRAGAEMTTFEMRFIALRCKDTISPTGTIAQGVGGVQINALGEAYEKRYGNTTSQRVYGTAQENIEGRGPCYLKTENITPEQEQDLFKAYLNMSPAQTLKWIERGKGPRTENVEIEGTEPYIIGGHTASGYWIDNKRATTIKGLYAAGDVAGGCPQKYVTGALVEGEIAAQAALAYIQNRNLQPINSVDIHKRLKEIDYLLQEKPSLYDVDDLEEAMQKIMDTYAGGIGSNYRYNTKQLEVAKEKIKDILQLSEALSGRDMNDVMAIFELKDRLILCLSVIAHLSARKETRWNSFAEHSDYPYKDESFLKYINSVKVGDEIKIIVRDLVGEGEKYEHCY
ncbi:MAG TPA: adenylyl-sulfate reductase subunit alpha [Epulopiscium sp.]|nr:adenylyl-sulfate reductase subunit alpha [Candidatus Epulonipiscium sp.]